MIPLKQGSPAIFVAWPQCFWTDTLGEGHFWKKKINFLSNINVYFGIQPWVRLDGLVPDLTHEPPVDDHCSKIYF